MSASIQIEWRLNAECAAAYRAWLEPDLVGRWSAPGAQTTRVEIDERVGGAWRTWKADDAGELIGGFDSELLALVPGERLLFKWGFIGPQRRDGPSFDTRLEITLRAADHGCVLTLRHDGLDELARAMPEVASAVEGGWRASLRLLAEAIE